MLSLLATLATITLSTPPGEYSERWLCDLWAGSQCHATQCLADGKERCEQVSRQCINATWATVPGERANRIATCSRATLVEKCGAPTPPECEGVEGPY